MSRTVTVEVTAEDIAAGTRESCYSCPVARACLRAGVVRPAVKKYSVWHGDDLLTRANVPLPMEAQDFIAAFDHGDPSVAPFSFELELS